MSSEILDWDTFMLALYESLDGIDYKTAKRVHKALYPEAKVTIAGRDKVRVVHPDPTTR